MMNGAGFARFCGNATLMAFAEKAICRGYCEGIPPHADELGAMVAAIFQKLVACCHSEEEFAAALKDIRARILRTDDPDFWFTQDYRRYKREVKPLLRFAQVKPWLVGRRVLDFGCGDGKLAGLLHRQEYQVSLTDVVDYRAADACALPFVRMEDPGIVPFLDRSFDTALVFSTLHHVDFADLSPVMSGLRRVARRVVVEEECYALPLALAGLAATLARDELLREFVALAPADQLAYLMFLDIFGNVVTGGLPQINLPLQFKTVDDWQAIFAEHGFVVTEVSLLGFQPAYFHRSSRIWFALDVD